MSLDPLRVSCPTGRNSSGHVWTSRNLSELVATCRNSCGLKGPTLGPYISKGLQVYCLQAASIMPAGRCLQAGRTEGRSSRSSTLDRRRGRRMYFKQLSLSSSMAFGNFKVSTYQTNTSHESPLPIRKKTNLSVAGTLVCFGASYHVH